MGHEREREGRWQTKDRQTSVLSSGFTRFTVRPTVLTPSTNLVRKMTFALLNMPSLSDTTMNWELEKWVRSMLPMFCVCDRSKAAST